MRCPEIDRLVDLQTGRGPDPELEAHLESCPSCQASFRIVQRIPAALSPEEEVPERLVQRVMAGLTEPDRAPESQRLPIAQTLITGLLASLTAIAAVVGAESGGNTNLPLLLLFSLGVGAVSVVHQIRGGAKASSATP